MPSLFGVVVFGRATCRDAVVRLLCPEHHETRQSPPRSPETKHLATKGKRRSRGRHVLLQQYQFGMLYVLYIRRTEFLVYVA